MHLGWQDRQCRARLHPMELAARLRAGCAHPVLHHVPSLPSRHPLRASRHLFPAHSLSPSLPFPGAPLPLFLTLASSFRRAPACSQFVSRVCAHTPYSSTAAASTRCAHPVPPCRPRAVVLVRAVTSYRPAAQHRRGGPRLLPQPRRPRRLLPKSCVFRGVVGSTPQRKPVCANASDVT